MSIPTGYEKLAVIGIAWKGEYAQGTSYKTMNGVYYKGSTYVALRDNPTGPPAADGANWQYLAKGFEQQLLSAITALDTSGVLGQAGASVGGQALMDAIADKVMTKLVERSSIVQTESTDPTTVPSSPYFKKVTDKLTSDLALQPILNVDILTLNTGHYYATNCTNLPPGWVAAYLDVERLDEQWCRITAWPPYEGVESPQIIKCFGGTWGNWISVLTSTNVAFFDVSRIDFLFNPATGESVIKFGVSSTRTDQIVVDDQHIRLDRWDGNTWTNIWTK